MRRDDLHQRANSLTDAAWYRRGILTPTLTVIGAGKVGTTLARLLITYDYYVTTVYSRSHSHATTLAQMVGAQAVSSLNEINGDLVLLTVADDATQVMAEALAGSAFVGRAVVHTSGAHDATVLAALAERGLQVGSLHPAYPFAEVETAIRGLPGSAFAIEAADEPLLGWLRDIVTALDGRALMISPGGKALYHAALVMASNYSVTLYAIAEALLLRLGADRMVADQALNVLMAGVVENLRTQGVPDALTGPLVRSDVGTIAAHLQVLHEVDNDLVEVYRELARLTYPLLLARGIAPDDVERLLKQDIEDAHHSP